ncbi:hypothetical protein OUZ56_027728 [Daphnia magna]|uniref:Uncharacterized protein n=1 Tax=Daphnia magna TaxID=35525 RepID=A0ABR0B1R2_9CRUS|nr:hypothetical protein OUZ56_027728 [Daphnia magna]
MSKEFNLAEMAASHNKKNVERTEWMVFTPIERRDQSWAAIDNYPNNELYTCTDAKNMSVVVPLKSGVITENLRQDPYDDKYSQHNKITWSLSPSVAGYMTPVIPSPWSYEQNLTIWFKVMKMDLDGAPADR